MDAPNILLGERVWIVETMADGERWFPAFVHKIDTQERGHWEKAPSTWSKNAPLPPRLIGIGVGDEQASVYRYFRYAPGKLAASTLLDESYAWDETEKWLSWPGCNSAPREGHTKVRLSFAPRVAVNPDDIERGFPMTLVFGDLAVGYTRAATVESVERGEKGRIVEVVCFAEDRQGATENKNVERVMGEAGVVDVVGERFHLKLEDLRIPCALCGPPGGSSWHQMDIDGKQARKNASWPPCKQCKGEGTVPSGETRWKRITELLIVNPSKGGSSKIKGMRERVHQPFYDSLASRVGVTTISNLATLFTGNTVRPVFGERRVYPYVIDEGRIICITNVEEAVDALSNMEG